jgi:hypothetical protein
MFIDEEEQFYLDYMFEAWHSGEILIGGEEY